MKYVLEVVPNPNRDKIWILLLFIGSLGSIYRPLASVAPNYAIYAAAIIIAVLYGRDVRRRVQIQRRDGLPGSSAPFDPFHISEPWPRDIEVAALANLIAKSVTSHILVTGSSGAGKTKLARFLLKKQLESDPKILDETKDTPPDLIWSDRYESPVTDLVERLTTTIDKKHQLVSSIRNFLVTNSCSIQDLFDPSAREKQNKQFEAADELWKQISNFLSVSIPTDRITVFVFDQLERIAQSIRLDDRTSQYENGFEIYFLIRLIEHLRLLPHIRTVFVVRGEYFYRCIDFLENEAPTLTGVDRVSVSHFVCPGINTASDNRAAQQIINEFEIAQTALGLGNSLVHDFREISRLRSRTFSNTFMIRLVGYVMLNYCHNDHVKDLIKYSASQDKFLKFYFDCLFNEYAKQNKRENAVDCIKVIIFGIAVQNRIAGRAIDLNMTAFLAHLPEDVVHDAATFLIDRGLLLHEGRNREAPAYRLAHDIISDYAIGSEQFSSEHPTWPRLKDAIRGLSEARADKRDLTPLRSYANPIDDLVGRFVPEFSKFTTQKDMSFISILSLIFIWLFYVYGMLRVIDPNICELSSGFFQRYVWASRECDFVSQFYIIIYVTHVVWVTYIYYVARNFLNLTIKEGLPRKIGEATPMIGAVLGIVFIQSPSLFLLPIITVGIIMGRLLYRGSGDGSYVGRSAVDCRLWAFRTTINMVIASTIIIISVAVLHPESTAYLDHLANPVSSSLGNHVIFTGKNVAVAWVYLINFAMIFFWWHVRPEQQTELSFASRLALKDRTLQEEKRNEPFTATTPSLAR
jgi:hypothetical protein